MCDSRVFERSQSDAESYEQPVSLFTGDPWIGIFLSGCRKCRFYSFERDEMVGKLFRRLRAFQPEFAVVPAEVLRSYSQLYDDTRLLYAKRNVCWNCDDNYRR